MARVILTLLGLAVLALGVWLASLWWTAVLIVLQGLLILVLIFLGIVMLIFGISEMAGVKKVDGG